MGQESILRGFGKTIVAQHEQKLKFLQQFYSQAFQKKFALDGNSTNTCSKYE